MKWLILSATLILTACNVSNEAADGGNVSDAAAVDGSAQGCDAAYCCTSAADIPADLICGVCHHDYWYGVVCKNGEVICDPKYVDDSAATIDGVEVLKQQDWEGGDGGCTVGGPQKPDGGADSNDTGTDTGQDGGTCSIPDGAVVLSCGDDLLKACGGQPPNGPCTDEGTHCDLGDACGQPFCKCYCKDCYWHCIHYDCSPQDGGVRDGG